MIAVGRLLKYAKENSVWMLEIGAGIDTWYEFLAQPEIGIPPTEANFLIDLGEMADTASDGEVSRIPTATAKYMSKHKGGSVMDAQLLTTKDYKKKYFEDKKPGAIPSFRYMVMKVNEDGTMDKVHGLEHEDILERIKDKING